MNEILHSSYSSLYDVSSTGDMTFQFNLFVTPSLCLFVCSFDVCVWIFVFCVSFRDRGSPRLRTVRVVSRSRACFQLCHFRLQLYVPLASCACTSSYIVHACVHVCQWCDD
eukprot:GDKI01003027.1.p1 GENE.GDKI01003027.1~~GDKI01003027.1.p1  ORF type:complete len:111 (-),score=3.88 GDKI01003027.1:349-681(-)